MTKENKPKWEDEIEDIYYKPWGTHPADKLALFISVITNLLAQQKAELRKKSFREELNDAVERNKKLKENLVGLYTPPKQRGKEDTKCKHCDNGCVACDARNLPQENKPNDLKTLDI